MDPFNFADALIGILSQRLARRLCPHCRKPRVLSDEEVSDLAREYYAGSPLEPAAVGKQWLTEFGRDGHLRLNEPAGCAECDKGYRGRIGIYELLTATPVLRHLVRTHGEVPQIVAAAQTGGMRLLKQDALLKVLRGELDPAGARAAAYSISSERAFEAQ